MKKIYLLFLLALLPLFASADTVKINGINYKVDPEAKTAEVIRGSDNWNTIVEIVIPQTITFNGFECKVTSIGEGAFEWFSRLTSITIPNSVTSIGVNAFHGCNSLTSVTIPNSVTSIGYDAFYGTLWYNNKPDGVVYAGKVLYCYKGTMPEGTTINIKDGTLGIAGSAFKNRSGLTSVSIPNSVITIGSQAFYGCSGLTSITIPNGVISINEFAFYCCSGLTSVTIPNSVTSIGNNAFEYCKGLTAIIIGNGLKSIGLSAFADCGQLSDFYCFTKDIPYYYSYYNILVNSNVSNATLHVPASSLDTYKETKPWCFFKNIMAIETVKVKLNNSKVTIEKGKTVTLKATISPSTFPDKSVTWKSSNTKVATVTNAGKVKAIKTGTATITCTSSIGEKGTCKVTVIDGGVKLDKTELALEKGKTVTLKATVYPSSLTDKSVTWKSSNTAVATVSTAGKVKGVKAGTATITCTSKATGLSATCKITVGYVKLDKTEAAVEKGKTLTLKATVYPSTLTDKSVTWKSSNTAVATVSTAGKVKGIKAGTATITCTSKATGLKTTCTVTVGYVKLDKTTASVKVGKTVTLKATVYPSTLSDKKVSWTSSNKKIATVTSAGKVKGVKAGTVTITCTSNATGLSTTCKVTVTATSGTRSIDGDDDDDTTGIEMMEDKSAVAEPYDVYDLSGRKVRNQVTSLEGLPNGIYIVNGKKMLKK